MVQVSNVTRGSLKHTCILIRLVHSSEQDARSFFPVFKARQQLRVSLICRRPLIIFCREHRRTANISPVFMEFVKDHKKFGVVVNLSR